MLHNCSEVTHFKQPTSTSEEVEAASNLRSERNEREKMEFNLERYVFNRSSLSSPAKTTQSITYTFQRLALKQTTHINISLRSQPEDETIIRSREQPALKGSWVHALDMSSCIWINLTRVYCMSKPGPIKFESVGSEEDLWCNEIYWKTVPQHLAPSPWV